MSKTSYGQQWGGISSFSYHHVVPGGQMMAELSGEYLTKYETNEGARHPMDEQPGITI